MAIARETLFEGEDQPMAITATARRTGGDLRCEVDVDGRHVIVTDEPERLGGTDEGPAPHELLAAMTRSRGQR